MSKESTELTVNGLRTGKIESGHFYPEPGIRRKATNGTISKRFKDGMMEKTLVLNGITYGGDTPVSRDIKFC